MLKWIDIKSLDINELRNLADSYFDGNQQIYMQRILIVDTKDFSIITEITGAINETLALEFSFDSKYLAFLSSRAIVNFN